jgi:hypothetical protein
MEFYALAGNIVFTTILLFFLVFFLFKTPLKQYVKAIFSGGSMIFVVDHTGQGSLVCAKDDHEGLSNKDIGRFEKSEKSAIFERSSRLPHYIGFSDYGMTIPPEWPPILEEIRASGVKVTDLESYWFCVNLSRDPAAQQGFLSKLKDPKQKEEGQKIIELLKKKIQVKPFRTYSYTNLVNMFPNNETPAAKETYADIRVRQALRNKEALKWLVFAGIFVLMICLAVGILLRMLPQGVPPEVVCKMATTGVEVANQTAQTITA